MPTDYSTFFNRFPSDVRERFEKTLVEAVRQGREQLDRFTEAQMVEAIKQALLCGDFTKLVVAGDPAGTHRQTVVYIPFKRVEELESEIARLKEVIADISSCGQIATAVVEGS